MLKVMGMPLPVHDKFGYSLLHVSTGITLPSAAVLTLHSFHTCEWVDPGVWYITSESASWHQYELNISFWFFVITSVLASSSKAQSKVMSFFSESFDCVRFDKEPKIKASM